jgi:hypothetical protein
MQKSNDLNSAWLAPLKIPQPPFRKGGKGGILIRTKPLMTDVGGTPYKKFFPRFSSFLATLVTDPF